MTTPIPSPDDREDEGAAIYDFPPRRPDRPSPDDGATGPTAPDDSDADTFDVFDPDAEDADDFDRESVADDSARIGGPVDAVQDIPAPAREDSGRRPVLPPWATSRAGVKAAFRHWLRQTRYTVAFHAVRLPKYAVKTGAWATVGAARLVPRILYWAPADHGNHALRQAAADKNDAKTWMQLDAKRQRQAVARWWIVAFGGAGAVLVAFLLAMGVLPAWWGWAMLAASIPLLTGFGRPADRRVTDRVREAQVYRKLTAELVRRALLSLQLGAINTAVAKDPNAIAFPTEIHRDGPGHLAIVDLPYGVE